MSRDRGRSRGRWRRMLSELLKVIGIFILVLVLLPPALILPLRWVNPLTTSLQAQRRVAALVAWRPYDKHMDWRMLVEMAPRLRRAVISSEDGRFYQHWGVDVVEAEKAYEEQEAGERARGASTITMQLAKNLYLWEGVTIYDKAVRKGVELYLTIWLEALLSKDRILEIYLNVIEWGDGVYGAEAAAQFFYHTSAARVSFGQAAHLAAVLPSPIRHHPNDRSRFVESRARRVLGRM